MASTNSSSECEVPFRAMSIARLVSCFSKPRLLTDDIPKYRHSFSLPVPDRQGDGTKASDPSKQPEPTLHPAAEKSKEALEQPSSASYVEWSKLLPVPSNLLGSFHDLFERHPRLKAARKEASKNVKQDRVAAQSAASAYPPPRLVFFGEQHHQPGVLRAQLQTLYALHQQCRLASEAISAPSAGAPPAYRLHLVLEHFSVLDQDMLNSFTNGELGPDELADAYQRQSEEGFHIGHYIPLLMLAKELNVPIWGGFPPRRWAKQAFRDGIDSVVAEEERRVATSQQDASLFSESLSDRGQDFGAHGAASRIQQRPPLFTSWNAVTKIGAAHRSYLSGLMRPDLPPRFPQLPGSGSGSGTEPDLLSSQPSVHTQERHSEAKRSSAIYPTWLLEPHIIEKKGFAPAQALKDSYLAHVTAWILCGARQDTPTIKDNDKEPAGPGIPRSVPSQPCSTAATDDGDERSIVNIALVVCGLGHCEYGFGAPERVVELLFQQVAALDDHATLLPYVIASKPVDSGIWLGHESPVQPDTSGSRTSDPVGGVATLGNAAAIQPHESSLEEVRRWLSDPWGRKLADAILLYDWVDDEPAERGGASASGTKPLPK